MAEEGKGKKLQKKWTYYEQAGEGVTRKKKSCPKCGAGVFLAEHPDRRSCGLCGYMEKKSGSKPEGKPEGQAKPQPAPEEKPKEEPKAEKPKAEEPKAEGSESKEETPSEESKEEEKEAEA